MRDVSRRLLILCIVALLGASVSTKALAERTVSQIVALESPGGERSFLLNKDAFVGYLDDKGGYVLIGLNVSFAKESLIEDRALKKGTLLIDETGERVGRTLSETEVIFLSSGRDGRLTGAIAGYVPRSAIDPGSVPETALAVILNGRKQPVKMAGLNSYIARMRFSPWIAGKGYRSYYIMDNDVMDGARFRLGLVLKQDTLVAVIHSRSLAIRFIGTESVKDEQYDSGMNMSYVLRLSEEEKRVIREVFFENLIYAG